MQSRQGRPQSDEKRRKESGRQIASVFRVTGQGISLAFSCSARPHGAMLSEPEVSICGGGGTCSLQEQYPDWFFCSRNALQKELNRASSFTRRHNMSAL